MKVYINGYKDHWISPYKIVAYMFFWTDWSKCNRNRGIIEDKNWVETPAWADKLSDKLSWLSCSTKFIGDLFDRKINYVKIDRYDTWSMDHTLAYIILPMLKQLRNDKHGSPMVDDEDVPEELRQVKKPKRKKNDVRNTIQVHAIDMEDDSLIHKKWDWVINEMIFAFECKVKDDDESKFWDHSAYDLGENGTSKWFNDMSKGESKVKCDWDGLRAHQARKTNGYRLFGKYYEGLWD
jgi:hypothetical protein